MDNWALLGIAGVFSLLALYWRGETRRLRHIPSVGSEIPFLSLLSAFKWIRHSPSVLEIGVRKWPNSMFKIPYLHRWIVVVTEPRCIDDLRKAPENVLSALEAIDEVLQTEFTLGKHISDNPYHIPIVRAQLTRALPVLVPEVYDEVTTAFKEYISATDDWSSVKVSDVFTKVIARASNRIFVGLPLCRDPDYVDLNIKFTGDVGKTGGILSMFPHKLRPFVNSYLTVVPQRTRQSLKHIAPLVAARRKEREEKGNSNYDDKSVDLLTWLMDEAEGEEATDWYLSSRILFINFAAIHTSSMTFMHALFYLAAYPEYLKPLRQEVEEVIKSEGWTKEGLDQMHIIDSFIKESQRMHPLGNLLMNRIAMRDFTFSNGVTVPAGTTVAVVTHSTHFDDKVYEDPMKFDGFRFAKMKEQQDDERDGASEQKLDVVSTGIYSLPFGHGRHACPGRFFAAAELKMMLALVVVNYDVKFENEGVRPPDMWISSACMPNRNAEVLFRKRRE